MKTMLIPECDEEPTKDDREPINDDEEEVEEALAVEVDNITETILWGFTPMSCYKKRRFNPLSPNTIMEDEDDSSSE